MSNSRGRLRPPGSPGIDPLTVQGEVSAAAPARHTLARNYQATVAHGAGTKKSSADRRLYAVMIVMALLYYSYRWFLKYNDASTSPTYSSTPVTFEVAKYVILLAGFYIIVIAVLALRRTLKLDRTAALFFTGLLLLLIYLTLVTLMKVVFGDPFSRGSIGSLLGAPSGTSAGTLSLPAKALIPLPFALLFPFVWTSWKESRTLARALLLVAVIQVALSAIEVTSYMLSGRLPALGYAGGLVRFGGAWDDPNGFSLFADAAILGTLAAREAHLIGTRLAVILYVVWTALLAITVSFSGWLALLVGIPTYLLVSGRRVLLAAVLVVAGLLSIILFAVEPTNPLLASIWEGKQASAIGHWQLAVNGLHPTSLSLMDALFGSVSPTFNEVSYIAFFNYYGLVGIAWSAALVAMTLHRSIRFARTLIGDRSVAFYRFGVSFAVAFLVGSLFVPYFFVFPINVVFWLVVAGLWTAPTWSRSFAALPVEVLERQSGKDSHLQTRSR